jgi:hypothetical protein
MPSVLAAPTVQQLRNGSSFGGNEYRYSLDGVLRFNFMEGGCVHLTPLPERPHGSLVRGFVYHHDNAPPSGTFLEGRTVVLWLANGKRCPVKGLRGDLVVLVEPDYRDCVVYDHQALVQPAVFG